MASRLKTDNNYILLEFNEYLYELWFQWIIQKLLNGIGDNLNSPNTKLLVLFHRAVPGYT